MSLGSRLTLALTAMLLVLAASPAASFGACVNPVSCENEKPGSSPGSWQVDGAGDSTIQGYATTMSVDRGGTIRFKVKTTAGNYHIDIYRLGYYQGNGARLQASNVRPTASLPQNQPACLTTASTGLIDCGNWGVSASWSVPAASVSGVYLARLVRDDNGGASQIPFVVRDDAASSDMLVRTSDATWQAYNKYGGNSLYSCTACPPGNPATYQGAFSVSYNRPFDGTIPQDGGRSYLFYAEYQMIRFIERNGYDASYTSQGDVDANPALLLNHDVILSSGHDEYWSGRERANVEAARDAGVSLAFFSGNEVFWKTRWQPSTADGTTAQYRTLTSYKDTHFTGPTDPVEWTGTWRDPRFSPGDGGRPENSLTGQLFIVNSGSADITVPAAYKNLRLWRNTAIANLGAGQSRTLSPGGQTLGYEWDVDTDNGFRPRGAFQLSSTTVNGIESFTDYGSSVQLGTTQTHHLTMYPGGGDALVFGAGTVQWAWGLDSTNAWNNNGPPASASPDPVMQQATINLFADMGAQPTTLMSGLAAASRSTDTAAPSSAITSPSPGAAIADGTRFTITGTATDAGGSVAGVEVSTDGGTTWHPATGTTSWSYSWIVHGAPSTTLKARAVDDSGNLESSTSSVSVGVGCPCTMAGPNVTPTILDQQDPSAVELGVRFKADLDGTVTGVRFYKATANTGSHIGNLWSANGTLLASGTFTGESATGWQQLTFATPVDITAGTTYVASYFAPRGHYSTSSAYFYMPSPTGGNTSDTSPLHALSANGGGANGVFSYGSDSTFPTSTFNGENYAVDVVFTPKLPPGSVSGVSATAGPGSATVNFSAPVTGGPPTRYVVTPFIGAAAQPTVTVQGSPPPTSVKVSGLEAGTSYTFKVQAGNGSGTSALSAASNAVTPTPPSAPGAPTALIPSAGNQQATVRWTAPTDGGATITRYTITPYLNGVAQPTTQVNGSPAPETGVVTGLTNGLSYTFTVTATNSVGTGPQSAASVAVTPSAAPRFIQRVSGRSASGPSLQLVPTSNLTVGDRMVVMAGVWSAGAATIAGVTDSAGNTYTKATSIKASENTELSVWSAPITAGGGTRPTITVTATGSADIGGAALEYAGLSTASGAAAIDALKTATGSSIGTGFVTSGPTPALAGDNGLALGFYADSGFGRTLVADPTYAERVNVSPTSDMEFLVEDALPLRGDTPAARVTTGGSTPWLMATVVFKSGSQAPAAPASLAVSPTTLSFNGTAGGASPAAKTFAVSNAGGGSMDWTVSESASWMSVSPGSGTNAGTVTVTPSISGLVAGTYTADVTVTAAGVAGSPKTVTVTLVVDPPVPPALSVSTSTLSFSATAGGASPAAKTFTISNTGGGSMNWTASESETWLTVSPASGTNGGTVTVTPSIAGLAAGTYTTDVTVDAPGATGAPKTVAVTLVVDPPAPPVLSVAPSTLSFSATAGGASPAAKTFAVSNTGSGSMDWTASEGVSWLSLSPGSGTNAGTVTVTPSITGLSAGTYTTDVTVTAPGATGSPKTVAVTLVVDPPAPPALSVTPATLAFSGTVGGASPAAKTFAIANTGGGSMDWTASESASWMSVSPASGTNAGTVTVTPSIVGLAAGTYTADVTVTAAGATGSPKTVAVSFVVSPVVSNLVGAWGFDEASGPTATDASGRGNTGTVSGATRNTGGRFGGALSFDGINDWVTVADADSLDLTTGMTLEAWVRPTAITGWRTVLLKEQPGDLIYALYAGNGNSRAASHIFTTSDRGVNANTATPINAWTHLAATYDGANLRVFVNGVQAGTAANTGAIRTSTGALRIGGNSIWSDEWFSGLIDELRVYNRALSATEIQADMTRPVTGS